VNEDEIYRLARMAAKSAAHRGVFAICADDLADMIQVAALAIWRARPGEREAYYFVAGRTAALNWLVWWKYGAPEGKLRAGLLERIETPLSLDWLSGMELVERPADERSQMSAAMADDLRRIFYVTRRKHGTKELAGIERDVAICQGLWQEDSTEAIGLRLGLSAHMVNSYREYLRKRLQRYIDGNLCITCPPE